MYRCYLSQKRYLRKKNVNKIAISRWLKSSSFRVNIQTTTGAAVARPRHGVFIRFVFFLTDVFKRTRTQVACRRLISHVYVCMCACVPPAAATDSRRVRTYIQRVSCHSRPNNGRNSFRTAVPSSAFPSPSNSLPRRGGLARLVFFIFFFFKRTHRTERLPPLPRFVPPPVYDDGFKVWHVSTFACFFVSSRVYAHRCCVGDSHARSIRSSDISEKKNVYSTHCGFRRLLLSAVIAPNIIHTVYTRGVWI
jgi:hypothetical protein